MEGTDPPPTTTAPWLRLVPDALLRALTLAPGLLPLGMLFGALAAGQGFDLAAIAIMSLLYLAGTAQFAALGLHATGASVVTIIALVALINSRYFLLSLAARDLATTPSSRPSRAARYGLAFFAVEETFALQSAWRGQGMTRPSALILVAAGTASVWVSASVVGALVGAELPDLALLGLDYALPGLFVGLVGIFAKTRTHWLVAAACVTVAGAAALLGAGTMAALLLPPVVAIMLGRWHRAHN